jgi:hypothetical protein
MNLEPREIPPPPDLERRTVLALRREGLLATPAARRPRLWQSVAAAAIFAAGLFVGKASSGPVAVLAPAAPATRFLFLLEGGPTATTAADEARTVDEYRAWASRLRDQGRSISGERLGGASITVPAPASDASDVRGFFVVSAATLEEATAVARSCPHAQRGGRVIVRPIEPT